MIIINKKIIYGGCKHIKVSQYMILVFLSESNHDVNINIKWFHNDIWKGFEIIFYIYIKNKGL
jgi:SMC interacting uncharacterized protein involved in chromosome segregation